MPGEFELIERIRRQMVGNHPSLVDIGIGDDCAVIRPGPSGLRWLVTTDMLMEGRHFSIGMASEMAYEIGRKAMAVNLSDIAAMAGTPVCAFASVALPRGEAEKISADLARGMLDEASRFETTLAGGDTNAWDGPLVINITLMGLEPPGGAVVRGGARPGDMIFVSGPLGGSFHSGRHLRPEPRLKLARELKAALGDGLHAMIDLSDGLGGDLRHILKESGCPGAMLHAESIPFHSDLLSNLVQSQESLENLVSGALGDGEDFELCFCVDPESVAELPEGMHHVGVITEDRTLLIRWPDGSVKAWESGGFDHFSR
ncbi:MAG: thiamine-phosphate kinase [Isosphaeraceae bacterium]